MTISVNLDTRIKRRLPVKQPNTVFMLLTVLLVCSYLPGQAKTGKVDSVPQKICASKLLNSPRLRLNEKPLPRRFNPHPSVRLNVSEDGSVHNVKIVATSRSARIDNAILEEARQWRFSAVPGCGIRAVRVTVIIDLR